MVNHIVHIHGLGPKPAQSILAERELRYISEGVSFTIPPAHFHLAYWADLMGYSPETAAEDEYKEGGNNFREYSSKEQVTFLIQGKTRVVIKDTLEDLLLHYLHSSESERPKAAQKVLNHLLSFLSNKSAELVYSHFLKDLHRYFFDGKRDVVLDRLRDQIAAIPSEEPVCLIAHSMGSIIAFDLLLQGTRNIEQVITIGSPLGLSVVQKQLGAIGGPTVNQRRVDMSTRISAWVNFYDPLDIVALDSDLNDDFPEQGIVNVKVRNEFVTKDGERNHHKSYGYLRTTEVGQVIRAFLQRT
jgi:hypothetical protein